MMVYATEDEQNHTGSHCIHIYIYMQMPDLNLTLSSTGTLVENAQMIGEMPFATVENISDRNTIEAIVAELRLDIYSKIYRLSFAAERQ